MKRFMGAWLSVIVTLASSPASAELLKNLRLGGQIDLQATAAHNVSDFSTTQNVAPLAAAANNDRIGDAQTRVMLHMDWDLLDDVHSRVTLRKSDRTYGTTGGTTGAAGSQTITATGGTNVLGNVAIDEAYFKIDKVAGQVDATFGRQFFGSSGDIVLYFGPSDKAWYGLPVSAVDAGRLDWNNEWLGVTGLAGKITGHTLGAATTPDTDLRGLNIALKGNEYAGATLYGWNRLTHNVGASGAPPADSPAAAGGKNDNLYIVGLKARLAGGGFWIRGEFAQNLGENRINPVTVATAAAAHYNGWAAVGNAGYKAESDNLGMFALWGEVAVGSGRQRSRENVNDGFVAINPDYRPGSIYGRFAGNPTTSLAMGAGVAGVAQADAAASSALNNRFIWGSGIRMSPALANKLVVGISWWDFRIHRFTRAPQQAAPFNGNRHIGSELDVDLTWAHSENVAFAAGWASFQPGGLIKEAIRSLAPQGGRGNNPATLAYFDTRIKF